MGTLLNIIGNHKLHFNGVRSFNESFKRLTGKSIRKEISTDLVYNFNDTEFAIQSTSKSNDGNEVIITLKTNHQVVKQIDFFEKTYRFSFIRYKIWLAIITNNQAKDRQLDEDQFQKIQSKYFNQWQLVQSFTESLTRNIGGNKLTFFEDDRFQMEMDELIDNNRSIESFMKLMSSKTWKHDLEMLELFSDEFKVVNGWFYQEL